MKRILLRWGLLAGFVGLAFYSLRGDNSIPDNVLDSVHLLKKPIEDLLPDLQEDTLNAEAVADASLNLQPYEDLQNSRERWNEMRSLIESGQPLFTPLPSEIAISTSPVGRLAPAIPPPPGFTVNLPYESRLTVSGRKTIGLTYTSTGNSSLATQQGTPTTTSAFELQQQLQVRINGQVGRKVTVNVDFDDTKQDKKDISIVYKGDPDEIVQRAAFGDITLSLPQTEFAGYSKQVFGASAELKYGPLHEYVIGSRTKGTTETKEFVGNVILQRLDVPDTSYIRYRYYNLTKLQIPPGKTIDYTSLLVYVDNRTIPPAATITLSSAPASGAYLGTGFAGYTYFGAFRQMNPGIEYTVDPVLGVITFNTAQANNAAIAVNFRYTGSSTYIFSGASPGPYTGQLALLKYDQTDPIVGGNIPPTEDLTHYTIGATKIVRDDGQGNFTLQLLDLNRNNVGPTNSINYLPNNSGQIYVDFEAGVFNLKIPTVLPFNDIYQPTPQHHFTFFVEFRSRVKTYTLRPNIVLNSEHILLNGRALTRDVDYFIDYESGFITFFNEDQITEDTRITATYDFSPFGIAGAQEDTLVGSRTELSLYPIAPILGQSLIGSTVLYDFSPQQTAAPDIHQTSGSFLVEEADIHFKDLIFNPIPFLKSSFAAEGARSVRNPNTFGEALIDNMEGIKDETSVSLSEFNFQVARNQIDPNNPGAPATHAYLNAMAQQATPTATGNLNNETIPTLSINPNAAALSGDRQQVLDITYDLSRSTEASIVTVLNPAGIDFTRKLFLEMYIQGDGSKDAGQASGTEMNIFVGQINEDADGTNGGGFTDLVAGQNVFHQGPHLSGGTLLAPGDGTPRTEDLNHNNTLDENEDNGWTYYDPDGTARPVYSGNLHLDSEDLDRNGFLNTAEVPAADVGYYGSNDGTQNLSAGNNNVPLGSTPNAVDFSAWQFVRVPLEISSTTATQVKELRISLRSTTAAKTSGTIRIAKLSIVGNRWVPDFNTVGSTVTVTAVNTEDDANPPKSYVSPAGVGDFDSLNQINTALSGPTPAKRKEQSLAIDYSIPGATTVGATVIGSSVTLKSVFVTPDDMTPYGSIRFFVHSDGKPVTFIFRAGSETDYWEFLAPMPAGPPHWQEFYIQQTLTDQRATGWAVDGRDPLGSSVNKVGNPDLSSISEFNAGVLNTSASEQDGELWFDELFVGDVQTRTGYAAMGRSDFEIFGWGTFGGIVHDIDRNFETFTSALTNQDRHRTDEYATLTRLPFFPIKLAGFQQKTNTPNIQQITNTTLVSVLQEGRVEENDYNAIGTFQIPKFPKIGLSFDTDRTNSIDLDRKTGTDKYGATLDYAPSSKFFFEPRNISLGYKLTKYKLNFGSTAQALALTPGSGTDPFSVSDTRDNTNEYSIKFGFQPLAGFTFNPNYSLATTHEYLTALSTDSTTGATTLTPLNYDKTKNQVAGFDSTLMIKKWFAPRVRYNITDIETYGIPLSSNIDAANFKTVDRTATGETTWDFAWRDFSKSLRPLQSLNISSSYLMEDGDSWNNVAAGYNSLSLLTVRTPLHAGNPEATLQNLTERDTFRSTQRWSPFDWATNWSGSAQPLKTLSLTSTFTDTKQNQNTTGTRSRINTLIVPDIIFSLTQTEYFFHAQNFMSNSQMNLKTQYKTVDTVATSMEHASSNGGDWRFTLWHKLDLFFSYTKTTDNTFDEVNNVTSSDSHGSVLSAQLAFNIGKWRLTPKYDQSTQLTVDANGLPTTDLTKRTPALQVYADLFLPAGLRLPFGDLMVFSNRIRTTSTISLTQQRSSLNALQNNTDSYAFTTSEDYELTSNMRLTVGGSYAYTVNKVSADANFYQYQFNSLLTIQF